MNLTVPLDFSQMVVRALLDPEIKRLFPSCYCISFQSRALFNEVVILLFGQFAITFTQAVATIAIKPVEGFIIEAWVVMEKGGVDTYEDVNEVKEGIQMGRTQAL